MVKPCEASLQTMNGNDVAKLSNRSVRVRSFQIVTGSHGNYLQYVRTIEALAKADMSFGLIADAGEYIGDKVGRNETDVSLKSGWQDKIGEIAEDGSKILAWQRRDETIFTTYQFPSSGLDSGREIMPTTAVTLLEEQGGSINVIEGIEVSKTEQLTLSGSIDQFGLENNPFLQTIPEDIV